MDGTTPTDGQTPSPPRARSWIPWVAGAVVAAVIASVLVLVVSPDSESAPESEEVAAPENGLLVSLARTGGGTAPATVGVPVSLDIGVTGRAPVDLLEVWDRDQLVGTSAVDDGVSTIRRNVSWVPEATGQSLLVARAVDEEGRVAQSNVVSLPIAEPVSPLVWETVEAADGDTLASVAGAYALDPVIVAGANPDLPAEGPVPAGAEIVLPVTDPIGAGEDPEPPEGSEPAAEAGEGDPAAGIPLDPPTERGSGTEGGRAPTVVVDSSSDPCAPIVAVEGDGDEFAMQALQPGAATFVPVADLASADAQRWQPAFGPGTYWVVAGTRTDVGQVLGAPTEVTIPDECMGEWSGDVRLVQGVLTGGEPVDVAYAYLSTDGGAWVRVPAADDAAVPFDGTGYDLRAHLPPLEGARLDVDAWGWRDGALVQIGTGTFVPREGVPLSEVVGAPATATLDIVTADAGGPDEQLAKEAKLPEPGVVGLRWSADIPGVTHGVWQVTWLPPDGADWLDPPGLVAQGTVPGAGSLFGIDTSAFADAPMTLTLGSVTPDYASVMADPVVAEPAPSTTAGAASGSVGGEAVLAPNLVSGTAGLAVPPEDVPLPPPSRYWIRIVPMIGDQPAGVLTNSVVVDATPAPPPEGDPTARKYLADATLAQTPAPPDFTYSACMQLSGWDLDEVIQPDFDVAMKHRGASIPPLELFDHEFAKDYWQYQVILDRFGQQVPICAGGCYGPISFGNCSSPGLLESTVGGFVGAIVSLWDDGIVKAWDYAKSKAVEALSTFSGCRAIAGAVAGKDGEDACDTMARAGIDAALISVGIPPNLPTTGEIIESAKGDLKVAIVELAEAYGVPCDDLGTADENISSDVPTCEEVADQFVEELEDTLEEAFRQQANGSSGLYFPPGSDVAPHPKGQITPAIVDLTITPNREGAAGIEARDCDVVASLHSTWQTPDPVLGTKVTVDIPGTRPQAMSGGWVDRVLVTPQTFEAFPFEYADRRIAVDPQEPVTTRLYLSRPSLLFPVPVTYWVTNRRQAFEQLPDIEVPDLLPRTSFLLQPGAVYDVTVTDPCTGITTLQVDTGEAGPQS